MFITCVRASPALVYILARKPVVIETNLTQAFIWTHGVYTVSMLIAHMYATLAFVYIGTLHPLITTETFAYVGSYHVYTVGVCWARSISRWAFVNVCTKMAISLVTSMTFTTITLVVFWCCARCVIRAPRLLICITVISSNYRSCNAEKHKDSYDKK